jgi:hypothetical protein
VATLDQALDLLRRSDRSFQRTQHRRRRVLLALALTVGPIYLGGLALAVILLIRVWQGGDWLIDFWGPVMSALIFPVVIARVTIYEDSRKPLFEPIAALRDALRRGDDARAPKVNPPAGSAELPPPTSVATGRIGPVRRASGMAGLVAILCAVGALVLLAICVPAFLTTNMGQAGVIGAAISAAALLPTALLLLLYGMRSYGRFSVTVDEAGLRWRTPSGRRQRLAWADAYALFELHRTASLATNPETQYAALGTRTALAWRLPNARTELRERTQSAALCRAITERTGLPLHNATAETMRIVGEVSPEAPGAQRRSTVPKDEVRRRFKVLGILAAPALVVAVIAGGLQVYQPRYYDAFYGQATAHSPLATDPLTQDDGVWPVADEATFAGGAYHIAEYSWEPVPRTYDTNSAWTVVVRCAGLALAFRPGRQGGPTSQTETV